MTPAAHESCSSNPASNGPRAFGARTRVTAGSRIVAAVVGGLLALACGENPAVSTPPGDDGSLPLRALAARAGLSLGTEVWWDPLNDDTTYRTVLEREFDTVIPGDFFRWDRIHPSEGQYEFGQLDHLATLAEGAEMELWLGHLVWHPTEWLPLWFALEIAEREASRPFPRPLSDDDRAALQEIFRTFTPTPEDRARAGEILESFVTRLVTRYRGRAVAWNVVNEVIADDPPAMGDPLRTTFWKVLLGPDYIERAFRAARAADPDAMLVLNDYDAEGLGTKSDRVYELVATLRAAEVPVDVVGLQMHVEVDGRPTVGEVRENLRRLAALGVKVWITEMDVRLPLPATPALLDRQAARYREMLSLCVAEPACTRFMVWGFTDRYSWIPAQFPGYGAALPFDQAYAAKPAYEGLRAALGGSFPLARAAIR